MHGLVNSSIEAFLRRRYGEELWGAVAREAQLPQPRFEPMFVYDDDVAYRVIDAASTLLDKPTEVLLEDLGTHLVSSPNISAVRRLLRFGGIDFIDFLHSLNDLRDRMRLAVPDLVLPVMELSGGDGDPFRLVCQTAPAGFDRVIMGLLRAMADEYGALALIELVEDSQGEVGDVHIEITVAEERFAEGRDFDLGGVVVS
ncbi:MAG: heme NO-binding domain-containing protein [Pseudomonadota bacterium]